MRRNLYGHVLLLLVMAFAVLAPGAPRAMAQAGLQGDDSYVSPQFGYTVTWGEDWNARDRDVISNIGGYDTLTLRGELGTLWVQGQGDTESAANAVVRRIGIEGSEDDIVAQDLDGDVPMTEMLVRRDRVLIEGYTLDDAVVVIVLSARDRDFDEALASVHEQVRFNDGQILTGGVLEDAGDDGETVDLTEEPASPAPTDAPDQEESATAEATFQDAGEDEDEDAPGPQISEDDEDSLEPAESAIEDGIFTSTLYDYVVAFDEDIWTVENEFLTDSSDGFTLESDLSWLTIWAWDGYGADAATCLEGESTYYEMEDPTVIEWELAVDGNGEPLMEEGRGYAWGVYTLIYVNDEGEETELVDYIECREIPGDDAVVIVFASAPPDIYNDHLLDVLDVADSIEIEGQLTGPNAPVDDPGAGDPTEEPIEDDPTEEPTEDAGRTGGGETGLSGSLFTSLSFDFTVEIPAQWRIEDEVLDNGNEQLFLSNGTSDVMLWATMYDGDLAGCVDFAAGESGYDLELDVNAEGEPFRAEGRREAYGNFIYTGDDGEAMTYFISCMEIVEGESVLILTQDVPYDQFASQRKFRAELQDAIVIPE